MKKVITILLAILGFTQQLSAQCGPTELFITPDTVAICEGDTAIIDLSANGTCAGNYEYQISNGAVVVQAWSTSTVFNASPSTTTIFTVEVRCDACPATVLSGTLTVLVTEEPTVTGDTLVCFGSSTTLMATGNAQSIEWWDAQSGGSQLSVDSVYTTPPLTSDQTFWVHAGSTSSGGGGGSILITEAGLEGFFGGTNNEDYLEITNLYTTSMNTAGWVCAISDSYTNINAVNNTYWNLPASFPPCDIQYRTDYSADPNYWGSNMFWNGTSPGWAIIIDDVGNVIDFIAWGWTAAQISTFNPIIAGFPITLGAEWVGAGCPMPCQGAGGNPYSFSRTGNADNNDAGDFVCQATSLDAVNFGLSCGWSVSTACAYPFTVLVDQPPTASNPADINVECVSEVPAPDINVVTDEADDYTATPSVTFISDASDGLSCPETITRTYRVMDSCSNYIDITQSIIIQDLTAPIFDAPATTVTVECLSDVPAMTDLGWTDNCDGTGTVTGVDASDGNTCPETITRTWTYTDVCGNIATETQTIIVDDITPPTASNPPAQQEITLPVADPSVVIDAVDNCTANPVITWIEDVSDGELCPETVIRTYSVTDECGNEIFVTQEFTIGDPIPVAQFIADPMTITNLDSEVQFTNTSTGATSYSWDFGDGSPVSTEENPLHLFPGEGTDAFVVELIVYSPNGCTDTFTLVIQLEQVGDYEMPNVFTPNNDNSNDYFLPVFYEAIDNPELIILNRWGNTMFTTTNLDIGWDGKSNNAPCAEGVYYWILNYNLNGESFSDQGYFHLSR